MTQSFRQTNETPSKKEFIRSRLRDDIVQGRYDPGDPISERAVAQGYAVSRIPVREALIELERDGLVSILPGRGAQVRLFSAENMRSLYEVRESLEGMAARLAAQRLREGGLAALRERIRIEVESGSDDLATLTVLGDDFHDAVIRASRNSVIIEMTVAIADRVKICKRLAYGSAPRDLARKAAQEHLLVAEAIEAGDPELAEGRMRAHIATWGEFLQKNMTGDR